MTYLNRKLLKEVKGYYGEDLLKNFKILKLNKEIFVVQCKETGIKIAIKWVHIQEKVEEIRAGWLNTKFRYYNYEQDNKMFFEPDMGFLIKGYGEFLLQYSMLDYDPDSCNLWEFEIGNVKVSIGQPTNLFQFIFNHFSDDDAFPDWNSLYTIKLTGGEKGGLEEILQQSFYIISKYNPSILESDYPSTYCYTYEDAGYLKEDYEEITAAIPNTFKKIKYPEALAFFNNANHTCSPIDYYKVIEYFFIINRKEEIKRQIDNYNTSNKIDSFIDEITKIYNTKEGLLLEYLLNNITGINEIIDLAFNKKLISEREIGIFSSKLYEYRNSIVHGKKDTKLTLMVPKILGVNNNHSWDLILKYLAEKVIDQFCLK